MAIGAVSVITFYPAHCASRRRFKVGDRRDACPTAQEKVGTDGDAAPLKFEEASAALPSPVTEAFQVSHYFDFLQGTSFKELLAAKISKRPHSGPGQAGEAAQPGYGSGLWIKTPRRFNHLASLPLCAFALDSPHGHTCL
jgi:hypothetical protein